MLNWMHRRGLPTLEAPASRFGHVLGDRRSMGLRLRVHAMPAMGSEATEAGTTHLRTASPITPDRQGQPPPHRQIRIFQRTARTPQPKPGEGYCLAEQSGRGKRITKARPCDRSYQRR
jgi:hypothetical protein